MDYDKFYGKITKIGDSAYILVPVNIIRYSGLDIGQEVEVFIKKKVI